MDTSIAEYCVVRPGLYPVIICAKTGISTNEAVISFTRAGAFDMMNPIIPAVIATTLYRWLSIYRLSR
jgi:hypothetical protein